MSIADPAPAALSDYASLAREIRERGLLLRRTRYYAVLIALGLASLVAVVCLMVAARESWWILLVAPVYAVVSMQITFIGHDAAHRQIARGRNLSALIGLVHGNLLTGLSYGWWVAKHNAHHAHPNDLESDPDVAVGAFVFDADQAATRTGFARWITCRQAWLFFPFLLLEAFNLHWSSVAAAVRDDLRWRRTEITLLAAHFLLYAALLIATMTWPQALAFLALHKALFGLYLGCSFAPSHKGMPALSADEAADPLLRQVLTSRNIKGGALTGVVYGGLNLQIEHHLFPSMPRPNLRRAQPVVKRFCEDHHVPYAETSVLAAYGLGVRHLHRVGAALRTSGPATGSPAEDTRVS